MGPLLSLPQRTYEGEAMTKDTSSAAFRHALTKIGCSDDEIRGLCDPHAPYAPEIAEKLTRYFRDCGAPEEAEKVEAMSAEVAALKQQIAARRRVLQEGTIAAQIQMLASLDVRRAPMH